MATLMTEFLDLVLPSRRPLARLDHPRLGQLLWSRGEEGWLGQVVGIQFVVARVEGPQPDPRLIAYAENVLLADAGWLSSELEAAKTRFLQECGQGMAAYYGAELDTLSYDIVRLFMRERTPALFAHLGEGKGDRLWHIEFVERTCEGLGFDT